MSKLKTEKIVLPDSGIKCEVALSHRERTELQKKLFKLNVVKSDKEIDNSPEKMEAMLNIQEELRLKVLKSWSIEEDITIDNIGGLSSTDVSYIDIYANKYLNPVVSQKKKENLGD